MLTQTDSSNGSRPLAVGMAEPLAAWQPSDEEWVAWAQMLAAFTVAMERPHDEQAWREYEQAVAEWKAVKSHPRVRGGYCSGSV